MDKPIVCLTHSSGHHAAHSGYPRFLTHLPYQEISGNVTVLPYRVSKLISRGISKDVLLYDTVSVAKELQLIKQIFSNKNGIAHFLNGEKDICFSPFFKKLREWKFTASFHYPPDIFKGKVKSNRYIKHLDGAVAVGLSQMETLRKEVGSNHVAYIPHGVDTDFFSPDNHTWEPFTGLFVGVHLRDFLKLELFFNSILKIYPNFKLKVVVRSDYQSLIPLHPNIEIFSGINDEALRQLYRSASFLILPLKDVTACNALLEAMACGLPIISTDLESNRGYLDGTFSFLIEDNAVDRMVNAAINLIEDEKLNNKMRVNARAKSLDFSLDKIANAMMEHYASL